MSITSRRRFLATAGTALGSLAIPWRGQRWRRAAHADPAVAPTRLLIIFKPNGTVPANYDCAGTGTDFTLSPILSPFADLRDHMVICDGLDIKKKANTKNEDHGNSIVTFVTGGVPYKADASAEALAERISIDQILAHHPPIAGDTPIASIHLAADIRAPATFSRTMAYAGRGAPIPSESRPIGAYARLFGSLADAPLDPVAMERELARQRGILDLARGGLRRLEADLDGEERARLDRHLGALTEVEAVIQRSAGRIDRAPYLREAQAVDPTQPDANHAAIGRAHLDLIRAAFVCDLTRVATFAWASGHSAINFSGILPGVESLTYHEITHLVRDEEETRVHQWYCQELASFLRSLRDTPDVDGRSLLDNTLVVVWSEMRLGSHTFDRVPIQLFGGAGGRLVGGRRLDFGNRPTNDLWLTIANALGHDMTVFGDAERCTGPLPGLFGP